MSNEVLVGFIALSGAVIGAAAAFSGVVYQQRRQADLARRERRDALAEKAVDTLMQELEKVRELAWGLESSAEETREWQHTLSQHSAAISLAALRLPGKELRQSIEAAVYVGFGQDPAFQEHVGLRARRLLMAAMLRDAQVCLGAYLRQEPCPPNQFLDQAYPFVHSMITGQPTSP